MNTAQPLPQLSARNGRIPEFFEPVLARLRSEGDEHFGTPRVRIEPVAYRERPFSHLVRAAVYRDPHASPDLHVYIKIFKSNPLDGGAARMRLRVAHDFQVSRRLHAAMAQATDFGVVRPIACYAEHLALVTEEACGETLLAHMQTHASWFPSPETRRTLAEALAQAGRWVRAFQLIDSEPESVPLAELRAYVDVRLQRLVAHGVFTATERHRVLEHLDGIGARIPTDDLRRVLIHADLAPANILVSGRRVVVLDLAMAQRGTTLHDIARLYVQLGLLCGKPQFRPSVIAPLQLALLRGFDPELTPDRPLFRFLLMLHRVNHLGTLSLHPEPLRARAFSTHIRRLHRRWIDRELQASEDSGVVG